MTVLLDANVLIAVMVADHVHHAVAEVWFAAHEGRFATCRITQSAPIRLVVRQGATAEQAARALAGVTPATLASSGQTISTSAT